ncbi:glycoside hydrolase family 43 [Terrabacter sp. 28]|nr:glycoside hydrolase family 43 [Terrabacter sp. 28]
MSRTTVRRGIACAAAALVTAGVVSVAPASGSVVAAEARDTAYENAVSDSFSDTFADPSVIRGRDGWWYAYATSDPLRAGDAPGAMHMARTKDWSSWEYLGTVFTSANRPAWATATAGLWAPDIRYVAGRYVLYFTVTDTTLNPGDDSAIGAATAPTPSGPWTPAPAPAVPPRPAPGGGFLWTFDPAGFTDVDGQRYLYYGSYFGGLWATKMSADGLTPVGPATQVAIDNRYEGSFVVRHGDWYYLMGSAANCCAGPTTGYSVFAGRARSPLGPFVDAEGTSLLTSRVGGTIVLTQNGNRFVGAGHHAVVTDSEGRDFIAYHAIDRNRPWLTAPFGINRRPMLLDRLDWVDGWPRTRAGAGPSDTPQPAPSLDSALGITPTDPAASGFSGLAAGPSDPVGGATAVIRGTASTVEPAPAGSLHVRLDHQGTAPLRVLLGRDPAVKVTLDPAGRRLTAQVDDGGVVRSSTAALPAAAPGAWRTLTVEATAEGLTAEVSESDLADVTSRVHVDGAVEPRSAPVRLSSSDARVDNVVVNAAARDAAALAPVPQAGALLTAEEFDDPTLAGFTWVRRNPAVTVSDGSLNWPVEGKDLVGGGNDAGVLLHDTPGDGDWIAEAKTRLDVGTDTVRNYQQVGIVAYENDDDFARLSNVAIWNTRQTEFGRETAADPANPDAPDGRTSYGGAIVGTSAPTLWLRLAHHRTATGEHLYRAGTSRDGVTWTWGATWTFRPGTSPRIGLVAHGGASSAVTAHVDHLRFYASTWPTDPGAG